MNNQATTTLEHLIAERAEKVLSELQWHDTLDVQNAVKKAFTKGFMEGAEYANVYGTIKGEDVVVVKPKKKIKRTGLK